MRPCVVVLPEPLVDDDLGLLGRREPLLIENLSTQCPVEPLIVAVLPGRYRLTRPVRRHGGGARKARSASPAKYRHPKNPNATWTGRGRRPAWIKDGLGKGKKLLSFDIK